MAKTLKRIDLGFDGGQVLSARVEEEAFESLRNALSDAKGWHQLEAQDCEIAVDLAKVVYLRVDIEEQRVGF